MRVALSGATSYMGMCIAEAFSRAGCETAALCRSAEESYRGLRRARLARLRAAGARTVSSIAVEDGSLAAFLGSAPLDVWVHHHHPMERFRAADYDLEQARKIALEPLPALVAALAAGGARAVILSGTYFEPGEGGQALGAKVTPYSALKGEVSLALTAQCKLHGLGFGKVVISAPCGALENEDRLTPQLILAASAGRPFTLRSPDSLMDVIPGESLAEVYVSAARALLAAPGTTRIERPSALVISTGAWAAQVERDILPRLGLAGALALSIPPPAERAPAVRFSNDPAQAVAVDWQLFAERYAAEWREHYPLR